MWGTVHAGGSECEWKSQEPPGVPGRGTREEDRWVQRSSFGRGRFTWLCGLEALGPVWWARETGNEKPVNFQTHKSQEN